jgi:hypothetical protein
MNPIEYGAEPFSFCRVDHLDESQPALQVRTKRGMALAILALGAETNTVGEGCFEAIKVSPHDIHMPVQYHARQVLSHALAHDSRLAIVHIEPFLEQNGRHMRGKSLNMSSEIRTAGKCKVICIARKAGPGRSGQTR